jgi:outer membrane protein assembly factor BamB
MIGLHRVLMTVGLLVVVLMGGGNGLAVTTAGLPTITLEKAVHFLTPEGEDVIVGPGIFEVNAEEGMLVMTTAEGEVRHPIPVKTERVSHEKQLDSPLSDTWTDEEDQQYAGLFFPDGTGFVAVGTFSGIQPRGLLSGFLNSPQLRDHRNRASGATGTAVPPSAVPPKASVAKVPPSGTPLKSTSPTTAGGTGPTPFRPDGIGWKQYMYDQYHTGSRAVPLEKIPTGRVVWRAILGAQGEPLIHDQSPVVASDGTIYLGTLDSATNRALIALNPDGSFKWTKGLVDERAAAPLAYRTGGTPTILADETLVVPAYRFVIGSTDINAPVRDHREGAAPTSEWKVRTQVFHFSSTGSILHRSNIIEASAFSTYPYYLGPPSSPIRTYDEKLYLNFGHRLHRLDNFQLVDLTPPISEGFVGTAGCLGVCFDTSGPPPLPPDPNKPPPHLWSSPSGTFFSKVVVVSDNRGGLNMQITPLWPRAPYNEELCSDTTPVHNRLQDGSSSFVTICNGVMGNFKIRPNGTYEKLWSFRLNSRVVGDPARGDIWENKIFLVATADGYLHAIQEGRELWKNRIGDPCEPWKVESKCIGAPSVVRRTGGGMFLVFIASNNGQLSAIDRYGSVQWIADLGAGQIPSRRGPAIVNGRIYVATRTSLIAVE